MKRTIAAVIIALGLATGTASAVCSKPTLPGPSVPAPYQQTLQNVYWVQLAVSQGNYLNAYTYAQHALTWSTGLQGSEGPWVIAKVAILANALSPNGFKISMADYVDKENTAWFAITSYYKNTAK